MLDVGDVRHRADEFDRRIADLKRRIDEPRGGWYPYDSLANFAALDDLLQGQYRDFAVLAGGDPILDIGTADGTTAFFLESLGFRVQTVDHPRTNFNEMRGLRAMHAELRSRVAIQEADIDSWFRLGGQRFGLALCLGVLYHLKHPFFLLEELARHTRYCILSTRVARLASPAGPSIRELPVAYLVGESETNSDATNYWIFSEAGLRRLFARTGWNTLEWKTFGDTQNSDPASSEGDERVFCLLESSIVERLSRARLTTGWHDLEEGGSWRWTERVFGLTFEQVPAQEELRLRLRFVFVDRVWEAGARRLAARVNGRELRPFDLPGSGEYLYEAEVGAADLAGGAAHVEFELDNALPPGTRDQRELGLIVTSVELG